MGDSIVSTLLAWDRGECLNPLRWSFPSPYAAGAYLEIPRPFRFTVDGWSGLRETEDGYRRWICDRFAKSLDAYIEGRRREAEGTGWCQMPSKCTPEHFNWLVLAQIKRLSHGDIARAAHRERSTVTGAIHTVAAMVAGAHSWLMPPLPAGRPPRADREVSGFVTAADDLAACCRQYSPGSNCLHTPLDQPPEPGHHPDQRRHPGTAFLQPLGGRVPQLRLLGHLLHLLRTPLHEQIAGQPLG
jgi:hypothetical protein